MFTNRDLNKAGIRRYNRGTFPTQEFFIVFYLVISVLALIAYGGRGSCADSKQAIRAMENMGFSEVEVIDKSIWFVGFRGCSSHDGALFTARGINPAGKEVEVSVCVGWPFKGATVRSH